MSDCSNSVNKYIIVQASTESGNFSGLTVCGGGGLTVDFISGCTSDGVQIENATFQNNTLTIPIVSATTYYGTTFSGGTFYGDGSNLTGISTIDSYMTGGTYSNGFITFSGSGNFSDVIVDVSGLLDDTNNYVTGGTVSGTDLILSRNGGLPDITIDTSSYFDNTDNYVSGGTYSNGNLLFSGTSNNQSFTIDVSALLDDTNTYVTGGTLVNGNTLTLNYNNGGSASDIDLSGIKFTGNTSGDCITDLHVSNIHACSPLNINPFDEGNVYFGSTSGVTIEVVDGRIITNYFRIVNTPTINPSLSQLLGRNVSTGNVEYLSASTFTYKSDFDSYSGSVQTELNLKLNISDFSVYTANTQTQIDNKLNVSDFNSYSAYTNNILTAHTTDTNNPHQTSLANLFGGSGHTHTLSEITDFGTYSGSVQTQLDSKLGKSEFDSYSSSTKTVIDGKLNTSDFNTYSGSVQTQIDSKLGKSDFDSYSSSTKTLIDSKISFSDAETRYVNVTGDTMTGTLILPAGTTTDPSLILSDGGTLLTSPQIGAFEFLGTSLYFTDFTGTRRNVLLAQSGFTATTVNALQDTEVSTVTNGQTWYYDGDTNFWRNTSILTIDDTNNKVDINSNLNVGGVFGITGNTVEFYKSVDVYTGNVNISDNSYFLQGTSTINNNVSLIGVDNQDRVYIGNQGYNNWIADDTTIDGDLHISGDLTVAGSATTVNIISEEVLIADNFITLNSNVTGGTPTENAGIEISRGDETKSRVLWNETTDLWEMGISGSTKRVILEGDSLSLLTSGHTHPISDINGLQTELDSKLNISNFNTYSGNVQTQIDSKLNVTDFNSYSAYTNSVITAHTTDFNNPHQTSLSNLFGGSGHTHTLSEITDFNSYSGSVQTLIDTKLTKSEFDSYSGNVQTQIDGKLNVTDFNSYSAYTNSILTAHTSDFNNPHQTSLSNLFGGSGHTHTLSEITDFSTYSGSVQTLIDTKLNKSEFDSYSGNVQTQLNTKVETASNLPGGIGLYSGKTGVDLQFKSLSSSGGTVLITQDDNTVNLEVVHTIDTDTYVTGFTINSDQLILTQNDGTSGFTVDLSPYLDNTDNYITGGTLVGNFLVLDRTDQLSAVTVDFSQFLDDTNTYVTGGTLNGNSVVIGRNDGQQPLTLSGGTNVTITEPISGTFKFDSPDTGEVNTASNIGVGQGVFSGKSGTDLQFYSLSGGSNTTLTLSDNTIVFDVTVPIDTNTYVTGFTINSDQLILTQNDGTSGFTVDLSPYLDNTDNYVTGGTLVGNTLVLDRTDSLSAVTVDLSSLNTTDKFVSGGTYSNGNLLFSGNSVETTFSVDVSALLDDTNTFVTGGTLNGSTLTLTRNDGVDVIVTGFSQTFTGNTSSTCITDLYVSNIHSCSPLHINPLDEGNVYFGSTSGVTIEVSSGVVKSNFFEGDGSRLTNIQLSGVTNLQTQLDSKTDLTLFNTHTGDTNNPHQTSFSNLISTAHTHTISDVTSLQTELDSKLNISNFNPYSGNVQTQIDNKLDITTFNTYTGDTQSLLDTKVSGATNLSSEGVFAQKNGLNLEFKGLTSTGGTVNISSNSNTVNLEVLFPTDQNTYVTGLTFNPSTYDLTIKQNNGEPDLISNLSVLATDVYVLSGVYDVSTGIVTYTNSTGGTFQVSGFTTGMTDSYTTSANLNGETIEFNNNIQGSNLYSVDLTPLLSGKTDLTLFNSHTGDTNNPHQTSFSNLISTAHTHTISEVINLQAELDSKLNVTTFNTYTANTQTILDGKIDSSNNVGGSNELFKDKSGTTLNFRTLSGGSNTTISTIGDVVKVDVSIPDNYVTGGTYSNNVLTLNRTNGSLNIDLPETYVTGATLNGNNLEITRNQGEPTISVDLSQFADNTDRFVSGGTYSNGNLLFSGNSLETTFTVDVSGLLDDTNNYVTGGTVSGTDLILGRNGGLGDITIDTSDYFDNTDRFVTGATMNGNILELSRSGGLSDVTVDLSQFIDDTNYYVTGFTYNDANVFTLSRNGGLSDLSVTADTMENLTITDTFTSERFTNLNTVTATTISGLETIDFNTNLAEPTQQQGRLHWSQDYNTLELDLNDDVSLQVGQEMHYLIKNQSGATIENGRVVRAAGTLGNSGRILGEYMIADGSIPHYYTLGIATQDILNGEDGFVTEFGLVNGIDTTGSLYGETWTGGTILYVHPTIPGGLTSVEPIEPNLKIQIAIVINDKANGSLFVRPSLSYNLGDLHNIQTSGETDGDLISYNSSQGYWSYTKDLVGDYTISGSLSASTISAGTINATTYNNLPIDPNYYVTGATYLNGLYTFDRNDGNSFSVQGGSNYSAGVIEGASGWTATGTGQINLPEVKVALYDNPNNIEPLRVYTVSSGTTGSGGISGLTNNDTNYVVINYNGGTPRYEISLSHDVIDDSSVVLFMILYRLNNFIHVLEFGNQGAGLSNKINDRIIMTERFKRETGLSLGLSGSTGIVTLTEGIAWNGPYRQTIEAVNSQDDIFFKNYHVGGNWSYTTTGDTLNNTFYDDGTDLVTATSGKYLVNWYYRGQEVNDHLYEVYGTSQYDSIADAELSTEPVLPELVTSHAFLTGRIIVGVGQNTGYTQSSFVTTFQSTNIQDHNDLTGLQGGTAGEYYHLTFSQLSNNAYTNTNNNFSTDQTVNGTFIANTISASTYQNLPVDPNYYVTGGTVSGTDLLLNRNDGSTVTIDTSSYFDNTDRFVTGGTVSGTDLVLSRSGGLGDVTIDTSVYLVDNYVTGGTLNNNSIEINRNDSSNIFTISGASGIIITEPTTGVFAVQSTGGAGGGESNTASNLGGGTGLFAQKNGVDLEFKSLTSTGDTITISNDSTTVNVEVKNKVNDANQVFSWFMNVT